MKVRLTKDQLDAVGWMIQDMLETQKKLQQVNSRFAAILTSWFGSGWDNWDINTLSVELPDLEVDVPLEAVPDEQAGSSY